MTGGSGLSRTVSMRAGPAVVLLAGGQHAPDPRGDRRHAPPDDASRARVRRSSCSFLLPIELARIPRSVPVWSARGRRGEGERDSVPELLHARGDAGPRPRVWFPPCRARLGRGSSAIVTSRGGPTVFGRLSNSEELLIGDRDESKAECTFGLHVHTPTRGSRGGAPWWESQRATPLPARRSGPSETIESLVCPSADNVPPCPLT